jgi:hypothetical protein
MYTYTVACGRGLASRGNWVSCGREVLNRGLGGDPAMRLISSPSLRGISRVSTSSYATLSSTFAKRLRDRAFLTDGTGK